MRLGSADGVMKPLVRGGASGCWEGGWESAEGVLAVGAGG